MVTSAQVARKKLKVLKKITGEEDAQINIVRKKSSPSPSGRYYGQEVDELRAALAEMKREDKARFLERPVRTDQLSKLSLDELEAKLDHLIKYEKSLTPTGKQSMTKIMEEIERRIKDPRFWEKAEKELKETEENKEE